MLVSRHWTNTRYHVAINFSPIDKDVLNATCVLTLWVYDRAPSQGYQLILFYLSGARDGYDTVEREAGTFHFFKDAF